MAEVFVNKPEAARRQIDCAIRIHFDHDDSLAIRAVVAAAGTLLDDLHKQRGPSPKDEFLLENFSHTIPMMELARRKDIDLKGMTNSEIDRLIVDVLLPEVQSRGTNTPVSESDFRSWKREYINRFRAPGNFLKHADRDPVAIIAEDSFANDEYILHACLSYFKLGFKLTDEMLIYSRWFNAVYPKVESDELVLNLGGDTGKCSVQKLLRAKQLQFGKLLLEILGEDKDFATVVYGINEL